MLNDHSPASRLENALRKAGIAAADRPRAGTMGVASPHRLATEWQGYSVSDGQRHYYAKVLHDDQRELIDLEQSAQASRCAASAGVTPSLILSDMEQGVLLFDALPQGEWNWARVGNLTSPQSLERLLAVKRRLHEGPKPAFIRSAMMIYAASAHCARAIACCYRMKPAGLIGVPTCPGNRCNLVRRKACCCTVMAWPAMS